MEAYKKSLVSGLMVLSLAVLAACGGGAAEPAVGSGSNGSNSGGGASAPAQVVELKAGHMNSPQHVQDALVMRPFLQELEKATEGRVKSEIYPGAALASPPTSYDAAVTGIADIMWGLQGYTAGKFPLTSVINLPFIDGGNAESMSRSLWEVYEAFPEIQKEYSEVKPLYFHASDSYQIVTRGKQVKTLEDIKGLKLRATSAEANALIAAWGGTPVSMPMPDMYDALQKGVVDGGVIPIAAIKDFNLGDVVDYVTTGDFHNAAFFVVMNKNSYAKLSPEDQKTLDGMIGADMSAKAGAAFDTNVAEAMKIVEEKGIEVYELPEAELQRFKDAGKGVTEQWIADMEAKGLPGQAVYDKFLEIAAKNKK